MKKLCLLLFLLALTLGCNKKFEYEYAVVCEFTQSFTEKNWLIVTAEDGTLLKEFEVPQGVSRLNEKFVLSQQVPSELMNLHLIQDYSDQTGGWVRVASHYGLRNGQSVNLDKRPELVSRPGPRKDVKVTVKGLSAFEQFDVPGCFPAPVSTSPNSVFLVPLLNGQGMALRLTNSETQEQRWLFVSDEGLPDSLVVSAEQFAPPQKKLAIYAPQASSSMEYLHISVYAVPPDLKHHVSLGQFQMASNEVRYLDLPHGLDAHWNFYLSCRSSFYAFDKIFPPGKPIQINHPEVGITAKTSVSGQSLSVRCSGPVDWLQAVSYFEFDQRSLGWIVMGSPSAFENLHLPTAVQKHLPAGVEAEMFKTDSSYTVRAFSAPEYGYDGMARGFPWKSTEPFVAGRKGFEMVKK